MGTESTYTFSYTSPDNGETWAIMRLDENPNDVTEISIPDTHDGKPVTAIAPGAFESNKTITSVEIPASITTIGENAFKSCGSLTTVTFVENSQLQSIGFSAFVGCKSLTSVTIPNSVTHLGDGALRV